MIETGSIRINYRHLARVREARAVRQNHNRGVRINWELYGRVLEAKAIRQKKS